MTRWLKHLFCVVFAQCYSDDSRRETQLLLARMARLERVVATERERHWRPRDTFGG